MLMKILEKSYVLTFFLFFFVWFSLAFILFYSAFLYRKVKKNQPEFFGEKNLPYYLTTLNSTQFIYYIVLNYHKKIRDPVIRRKCQLLRNFSYIVIVAAIFVAVVGLIGSVMLP